MLLIFPFVIIASFFGRIKGRQYDLRLCMLLGRYLVSLIWYLAPKKYMKHRTIRTKQYIFVTNHISYLDAPIIGKSHRDSRSAHLGKVEMAKVPLFGFIYRNAIVTVDRSSAENRAKSIRILKSISNKGISFLFSRKAHLI